LAQIPFFFESPHFKAPRLQAAV